MLLNPFTLHSPKTLKEAINLRSTLEGAEILAGGTFAINRLKMLKKKGLKTPKHVVSLRNIKEMNGITQDKDLIRIGAMTTISDIHDSDLLTDNLTVLKDVCKNIGTTTIRNMATIGGNLTCRYTWTEMPCALVALNAQLIFASKEGEETIDADDFFKGLAKTKKVLTHILLKKEKKAKAIYKRISKRSEVDIPLFAVCINAIKDKKKFKDIHIAINNGHQFVQRDNALEDFLKSVTLSERTAVDCLDHLTAEITDAKSDDYKKHISRITLKNLLKSLIEN